MLDQTERTALANGAFFVIGVKVTVFLLQYLSALAITSFHI